MNTDIERSEQKPPMLLRRNMLLIGGGVLIIVAGALGYFLTHRTPSPAAQQAVAREEALSLVDSVGKLMVLPDEEPIIATVEDPSQLSDQPFFKNALKGDKVLIFNNARKAVLYRPDTNRIVDVAPLSTPPSATPATK